MGFVPVYFSGSAGAIRTYAHLDALKALLPTPARVVGLADSGFYLDLDIFTPLKRFVVVPEGQNASAMLGRACKAKHSGQLEKCLIASVSAGNIQTPVFGWQSEYDLDQRGCEMTRACAASAVQ